MITLLIRNKEEARALHHLGLKAAEGMEKELTIVVLGEEGGKELALINENTPCWVKDLKTEAKSGKEQQVYHAGGSNKYALVEKFLLESKPDLLILGKHLHKKAETTDTQFSRHLYHTLSCQTLLVRLGEQDDVPTTTEKHDPLSAADARNPILVACGSGTHTRRALRLARALAGADMVAFHLTADVDPESSAFGKQHLNKILDKAGIDPSVTPRKVVLGTDITRALREVIKEGHEGIPYSMLLLGESQNRGLKEKLFGTIPDKLINKSDGLTLGVIRAERPVGHRMRNMLARTVRVRIPQLKRDERLALFEDIENKSRWSFDFAALMTLAAMVAGLGLLANSGAVVIGAMLLAPLMMPLIGSGLALAQGNGPLFKKALLAVVRGFLAALLTGLLLGLLARLFHIPLTDELAARGAPTLLDLGVAFVSGVAAAYCIARPNLSGALAGVAIAAALVPPIVTAGICLTMQEMAVAKGASLLFGTNVVAVICGSALNFSLAGIKGHGKAGEAGRRFIILLALGCLGLAVPLTSVLINKIPKIEDIGTAFPKKVQVEELIVSALPEGISLEDLDRNFTEDGVRYTLKLRSAAAITKSLHAALEQLLISAEEDQSLSLRIETLLVIE